MVASGGSGADLGMRRGPRTGHLVAHGARLRPLDAILLGAIDASCERARPRRGALPTSRRAARVPPPIDVAHQLGRRSDVERHASSSKTRAVFARRHLVAAQGRGAAPATYLPRRRRARAPRLAHLEVAAPFRRARRPPGPRIEARPAYAQRRPRRVCRRSHSSARQLARRARRDAAAGRRRRPPRRRGRHRAPELDQASGSRKFYARERNRRWQRRPAALAPCLGGGQPPSCRRAAARTPPLAIGSAVRMLAFASEHDRPRRHTRRVRALEPARSRPRHAQSRNSRPAVPRGANAVGHDSAS